MGLPREAEKVLRSSFGCKNGTEIRRVNCQYFGIVADADQILNCTVHGFVNLSDRRVEIIKIEVGRRAAVNLVFRRFGH